MKKTNGTAQKRSFRRWVRQLFAGLFSSHDDRDGDRIFEKLQGIEDSIELIAREIARHGKSRK